MLLVNCLMLRSPHSLTHSLTHTSSLPSQSLARSASSAAHLTGSMDKDSPVVSQFRTDCQELSQKSLQCSIDNKDNLQNCQDHFEVRRGT
jgi:hypothetical protein